jgi:acyl-CoA reductase-like NAD-dependent aldehyde dehydrogenase
MSSAETVDGAKVFIDGCFRTAAKAERVFEAATGEPLGDGSDATPLEIDAAVDAARRALGRWRSTPVTERAAVLVRFTEALESQSARVADLAPVRTAWRSRCRATPMAFAQPRSFVITPT